MSLCNLNPVSAMCRKRVAIMPVPLALLGFLM